MAVTFLASIVVPTLLKQRTSANVAWGTGACLIGLIFAARSRWELKEQWWFWLALLVGATLQVPLIFAVPWAAPHMTGPGAMVFVIPGFLMAVGCVFLAEKIFSTHSSRINLPKN